MGKKGLVAIALIVIAAVVVAGCGSSGSSSSSASESSAGSTEAAGSSETAGSTEAASSKEPIVIGGALALTGGFSAYDLENRIASEQAVEDINAKGGVLGRPLEYVVEDTQSNLSVGPVVATELISKGAVALITQCDFDYGAPAALVAQEHEIPAFSCATSPKFGVQDIGNYAYDVSPPSNEQGAAMAEAVYDHLKAKKAYVLTDTSLAVSKTDCEAFTQSYEEMTGTEIVGEDTFKNEDPSVQSQIARLGAANPKPEAIVLCSFLPGGPGVVRQIRAAGIETPIVTDASMEYRGGYKSIPKLSNFYITTFGSIYGQDPRPEVNKMFEEFEKTSGKQASTPYPILAYAEIQLIAEAIKQAGSTEGPAMQKALDSFTEVPTIAGPVTYTPTKHYTTLPIALVKYENGTETFEGLLTPKKIPPPAF
ncbi:MAG: ABC transporter substrate-binding protein [Actinobacteria bacterium]|nr:ABC transporter substrate-binding protein [Actinomycetota bacterium]